MITELNLQPEQLVGLGVVLLLILTWIVRHVGQLEVTKKPETDTEPTLESQLNPDYGRYVWLAGRYYN